MPENSTNKEVKWGSTNESVCTVEKGVVIATGYGTAVITATSIDGGYTGVCVVNVVHDVDGVITKVTTSEAVNAVYDLQGRRVMAIDKGLYIKNGMKFFK